MTTGVARRALLVRAGQDRRGRRRVREVPRPEVPDRASTSATVRPEHKAQKREGDEALQRLAHAARPRRPRRRRRSTATCSRSRTTRTRSPRPRASVRSRRTSPTQLFTAEIPEEVRKTQMIEATTSRRTRSTRTATQLTTAAEPLAEKSLDGVRRVPLEVDRARMVLRVVEAVRARARSDQAGRVPDGVRAPWRPEPGVAAHLDRAAGSPRVTRQQRERRTQNMRNQILSASLLALVACGGGAKTGGGATGPKPRRRRRSASHSDIAPARQGWRAGDGEGRGQQGRQGGLQGRDGRPS